MRMAGALQQAQVTMEILVCLFSPFLPSLGVEPSGPTGNDAVVLRPGSVGSACADSVGFSSQER